MPEDIKRITWISPRGVSVVFPWDLERYIFNENEFVSFKRYMHGKTCMMVGNGSAYYPEDIIRFLEEMSEKPCE